MLITIESSSQLRVALVFCDQSCMYRDLLMSYNSWTIFRFQVVLNISSSGRHLFKTLAYAASELSIFGQHMAR